MTPSPIVFPADIEYDPNADLAAFAFGLDVIFAG